ncbi:ATP-binding protein [Deinococcus oregonensis]|uniref:histidine kinase n=1 Tax=Deinococcus oregonensis TaxID=1805970 RepID=A0ABV6B2M3_9DEIO
MLDERAALDHQLDASSSRVRALNEEFEEVMASVLQEVSLPVSRLMSVLALARQTGETLSEEDDLRLLHLERIGQQLISILQSVERYIQARNFRSRIRTVALGQVWREVVKKKQPLCADREVRLTHDPLPVVQGCSQALTLILEEYLANALKYTRTREAARIHLRVRELTSEYVISMEDNGVGFNISSKDRLFRLFQRQHPSSQYEGSGLGLAIVRQVTERFGGRAWGEGRVERGATFSFAWPKQPRLHA